MAPAPPAWRAARCWPSTSGTRTRTSCPTATSASLSPPCSPRSRRSGTRKSWGRSRGYTTCPSGGEVVAKIVVTRLEKTVMQPLVRPGRWYWAIVTVLAAIVAWAVYAYAVQLQEGLVVTALRDRISWGLYVTTFVFFIGISHAGTLVSAILRVTHAEWRKPITRLAEAVTAFALVVGVLMVLIELGR